MKSKNHFIRIRSKGWMSNSIRNRKKPTIRRLFCTIYIQSCLVCLIFFLQKLHKNRFQLFLLYLLLKYQWEWANKDILKFYRCSKPIAYLVFDHSACNYCIPWINYCHYCILAVAIDVLFGPSNFPTKICLSLKSFTSIAVSNICFSLIRVILDAWHNAAFNSWEKFVFSIDSSFWSHYSLPLNARNWTKHICHHLMQQTLAVMAWHHQTKEVMAMETAMATATVMETVTATATVMDSIIQTVSIQECRITGDEIISWAILPSFYCKINVIFKNELYFTFFFSPSFLFVGATRW